MSQPSTGLPAADSRTGFAAFVRAMPTAEKQTIAVCFGGWVLDAVDFMIYPLVIGTIISLWHVDRGVAGLAVTMTLIVSSIGGWLAGYFSDRFGRITMLQITIIWFALFTLLCAFAQNFTQLIIFRMFLGLGFGGEWAAGAVLVGETVRPAFRGRAVGLLQSGWAVGWGLAVVLQAVCYTILPPEVAWRWMFGIGAAPALLVFFLRRFVQEPEIAAAARAGATDRPALWEIFSPGILKTTALTALLCTGAQGGYYAVTTWLPTFLRQERGLSIVGSTGYLGLLIFGSFLGYVWGAFLADQIGRRNLFILFAILAAGFVLAYTQLPIPNQAIFYLGLPLGLCASGYLAGLGAFLTELFPTRLRGSGQGFAYNFGRGIGSVFPTLVGFLSERMTLGAAIAVFAVFAYGLLLLGALLLPETKGRNLQMLDRA